MSVDCLDLLISLLAIYKKQTNRSKSEKMHFLVRGLKTCLVFQRISFGAKRNMSVKKGRFGRIVIRLLQNTPLHSDTGTVILAGNEVP